MTAALLASASAPARADLATVRAAAEDLSGATFAAHDTAGTSLDALDVAQAGPATYLGVHHTLAGGRFEVRLVRSSDLTRWEPVRTLVQDGAMPAIAAVPGGGWIVADERGSTLGVLPTLQLPPEIAGPTRLWMLQKTQLRFRFYASTERLLAGRPSQRFVAPRRLSVTNEGTPSIAVTRTGPGVAGIHLEVGLHFFAALTGDGVPDADRQATGTLDGMRRWLVAARPDLDAQVLHPAALHPGFTAPPTGSVGDRDDVTLPDGTTATLTEAQYRVHQFGTWRLWLRDPAGGPASPLVPRTPGGSSAIGNPSMTALTLPDGRPALVFTAFVFGEGAAPGEAGEVVSVRPL
jgi:hypothetical protein